MTNMKKIIITPKEAERRRRFKEAHDLFKRGIAGEVESYDEIKPTRQEYEKHYLGDWTPEVCATKDSKGNHCPSVPTREAMLSGVKVSLCDDCYRTYKDINWVL